MSFGLSPSFFDSLALWVSFEAFLSTTLSFGVSTILIYSNLPTGLLTTY